MQPAKTPINPIYPICVLYLSNRSFIWTWKGACKLTNLSSLVLVGLLSPDFFCQVVTCSWKPKNLKTSDTFTVVGTTAFIPVPWANDVELLTYQAPSNRHWVAASVSLATQYGDCSAVVEFWTSCPARNTVSGVTSILFCTLDSAWAHGQAIPLLL